MLFVSRLKLVIRMRDYLGVAVGKFVSFHQTPGASGTVLTLSLLRLVCAGCAQHGCQHATHPVSD